MPGPVTFSNLVLSPPLRNLGEFPSSPKGRMLPSIYLSNPLSVISLYSPFASIDRPFGYWRSRQKTLVALHPVPSRLTQYRPSHLLLESALEEPPDRTRI